VGGSEEKADDDIVNNIKYDYFNDEMVDGRKDRDEEADDAFANNIDYEYFIDEMVGDREEGHMDRDEHLNRQI
jgi:hypothetical protein